MATNLFSKAAAYRKRHPGMTMPEAVKAVSKGAKAPAKKKRAVKKHVAKKKTAARKKAAPKKRAVGNVRSKKAAAPRKIKIKVKPGRQSTVSISGVSMGRLSSELHHKSSLENKIKHLLGLKKGAVGTTAKAVHHREILLAKKALAACKKHITALKRTI